MHPTIKVPVWVGAILTTVLLITAALEQDPVPAVAAVATAVTSIITGASQYVTVKVSAARAARRATRK